MAGGRAGELKLDWRDLAIGFIPLLVAIGGSIYVDTFGRTVGAFEMVMVADSHLEAAGRLRMLATSFLTTVAGVSAIGYFFWNVRLFENWHRAALLGAYVVLAALGLFMVSGKYGGNSEVMMTKPVLCAPLELIDTGAPGTRARMRVWIGGRTDSAPDPVYARKCSDTPTFRTLEKINNWHRYLLVLILPAAVLGAVSCLGRPAGARGSGSDPVERLKIWIYLTAVMFVAGLLFMSALLRWPGFAYQGVAQAAYNAHVSAYVLYLGVLYTIFIASYYLPIYARLATRHRVTEASVAAEPINPLDLGKIMLGVFAPAIAGLLGDVIQF